MTREDTIKILSILKASYPNFYKDMSKKDAETTVNLYTEMFEHNDSKLVAIAIKELIQHQSYPPTIADIKNKIDDLTTPDELNSSDLWEIFKKTIQKGYYGNLSEFEKLPDSIKIYLGNNPGRINEIGMMESNTLNTVEKGIFMRQIEAIKNRIKSRKMMLPETQKYLNNFLSGNAGIQFLN
jgi:hypothetical protein|nr:MAG TPA: replisome organizer [Caudoviricetes sp.]